jgi:hypothetical protein
MRFIRVQFDAYGRQLNVVDRESASQMEDGGIYLIADLSPSDFLPAEPLELPEADHVNA